MTQIYVAGIAMTVFGRHPDRRLHDLAGEALNRALPIAEIAHFVNSLACRIAAVPAGTIALVKQAVDMADTGLEDGRVREGVMFPRSAHADTARRRMAAGLAGGLRTAAIEKCRFEHIRGAFADSPSTTR